MIKTFDKKTIESFSSEIEKISSLQPAVSEAKLGELEAMRKWRWEHPIANERQRQWSY